MSPNQVKYELGERATVAEQLPLLSVAIWHFREIHLNSQSFDGILMQIDLDCNG